jgi:glyoxylase-like metal-dependent hydrolase (beta-lactamase superfamily II)
MVTPLLIRAGNPSEWTGPTGNNTWLLRGRGAMLVDAGVGKPEHIEAVARALDGAPLARVLITHGHRDHVEGLPALRDRWPDLIVVPPGTTDLEMIPTPGHASDHVCFFDRESGDLYCGDLARRGGTILIPRKGGDLAAYLESLRRIRELRPGRLLPGHGPIVEDPIALIDRYLAHRAERDRQILSAVHHGAKTVDDIVNRVYPGLSPVLKDAAAQTVEAHLRVLGFEREPENPENPRNPSPPQK